VTFPLLIAFGFPLITAVGYGTLLIAVYQRRFGKQAEERLDRDGLVLYPLFLAIPVAVVLTSGPARGTLDRFVGGVSAGTTATSLACVGAIGMGVALFSFDRWASGASRKQNAVIEGRSEAWEDFGPGPATYALLSVLVVVGEEIVWRGIVLGGLHDVYGWSAAAAVALSAVTFGVNHYWFGLRNVALKAVHGAVWGAMLLLTGSLLVPIVSHLAFEAVVGLRLFAGRRRPHAARRHDAQAQL
jgi:membrane protease YdiL (CAAX protease family)